IVLQNSTNIMMKIAKGFHQPGNSRITRRVFKFRTRHHPVIGDIRYAAKPTNNFQHSLTRRTKTTLQHIAYNQSPGIDKGVAWDTLLHLQLYQRVKRRTGGIFTHSLPNLLLTVVPHRHYQTEHLGDRLNRETLFSTPGLITLPINSTNRHSQTVTVNCS